MTGGLRPSGTGLGGGRSRQTALWMVLAILLAPALAAAPALALEHDGDHVPGLSGVDFVNITATSTLSFVPSSFTVQPGAVVHLIVTQAANFNHTFTLSSVANVSVPSVGYFSSHPPLVNLSLGTVLGKRFFDNFTAPAVGTYEYVCEFHYPTMKGSMTSSTALAPPSSNPVSLTPAEIVATLGILLVLVGVGVAFLVRRRRMREEAFLGADRRKRPGS